MSLPTATYKRYHHDGEYYAAWIRFEFDRPATRAFRNWCGVHGNVVRIEPWRRKNKDDWRTMTVFLRPDSLYGTLRAAEALIDEAEQFLDGNFARKNEGVHVPPPLLFATEDPPRSQGSVMCCAGPLAHRRRSWRLRLRNYARQQLRWSSRGPYRANYIPDDLRWFRVSCYAIALGYSVLDAAAAAREFLRPRRRR